MGQVGDKALQVTCCARKTEEKKRRNEHEARHAHGVDGVNSNMSPDYSGHKYEDKAVDLLIPSEDDAFTAGLSMDSATVSPKASREHLANIAGLMDIKKQREPMKELAKHRDPMQEKAEEIENLSAVLRGPCTKYPVHGGFFSGGAKERYIAVEPADEHSPDLDRTDFVKRWRRGILAYWANESAFVRRDAPKGSFNLLGITKVSISDTGGPEEIIVKCKDFESNSTEKLLIRFNCVSRAEEWREALRRLRGLLA